MSIYLELATKASIKPDSFPNARLRILKLAHVCRLHLPAVNVNRFRWFISHPYWSKYILCMTMPPGFVCSVVNFVVSVGVARWHSQLPTE